ncbi:MAG TPA: M28 family peptidase [Edaphocola sp.]|nr:M28 family peptidase [Edaphocola sp.]
MIQCDFLMDSILKLQEKWFDTNANRLKLLMDFFKAENIKYELKPFDSIFGTGKNILVPINNKANNNILITAHYDDDGIYDNFGGVVQLISLIQNQEAFTNYNIDFLFTDQEERFQQGIYQYLKMVKGSVSYDVHLNIDGIGIGKSLICYKSNGHFVVDWLCNNSKSILLTDNTPLINSGIPSYHIFSCLEEDSEIIIKNQKLSESLCVYFDESWCKLYFNNENISYYTPFIENFLKSGFNTKDKRFVQLS